MKAVGTIVSTGMEDCTYHYYLCGGSVIEERNGSGDFLKEHVWGLTYVDEAVETSVATSLSTIYSGVSFTNYFHLQDANFNELAPVNASGTIVERYEYSAYGQRQVFYSAGSNDSIGYTSTLQSRKAVISSALQPYGINEIGHQGLIHDEQTGLVYERNNYVQTSLGRHISPDGLWPAAGLSWYSYEMENPVDMLDPLGLTPWTNLRTTESVQQIVGVNADGIYGPETAAKVGQYQQMLAAERFLPMSNVDGKWGNATEIAYTCQRCKELADYMDAMTNTLKGELATLEKLHGEKNKWQSYYNGVLGVDIAATVLGGVTVAADAVKAASALQRARQVAQNTTRLAQSANAAERLLAEGAEAGGSAARGAAIHVGASVTLWTAGWTVETGREKMMGLFDPLIEQTMNNIEDISHGWSSAYAECQKLGCKR